MDGAHLLVRLFERRHQRAAQRFGKGFADSGDEGL
jgi:hypothetical protein